MNKFKEIANAVVTTPILLTTPATRTATATSTTMRPLVRSLQDFYRPLDVEHIPYEDWFFPIMNEDYVTRFLEGMLTYRECRNIGFSEEQTRRPELVRTVINNTNKNKQHTQNDISSFSVSLYINILMTILGICGSSFFFSPIVSHNIYIYIFRSIGPS